MIYNCIRKRLSICLCAIHSQVYHAQRSENMNSDERAPGSRISIVKPPHKSDQNRILWFTSMAGIKYEKQLSIVETR